MTADPRTRQIGRSTPAGGRRRLAEARREEMLRRLLEMFLAEGFSSLTVEEIASRLRCSKSTLYAVAPGKDQLVAAAMKCFFREATTYVEDSVARVEDPRDRIAVYLASIGDRMRQMSPACYSDMTASETAGMIYQLNARASARRVRELIHEGVKAKMLRPVHAEFVAESVGLLIDGIMHGQLLERTGLSSGDAYHELSTLVLQAMAIDGDRRASRPTRSDLPAT
ncbi:TetR/AcrR family transcriptional regulator [Nocardioides pocheonensis]|jgi:AcrR family transcriptional regulator|uniref:TetR/AcrR family transcriptional regulator n=1 Tax=Nocardioides pocheonensis TaxID=661485 RepID=A0A3N0GHB9_9ACTN|nr:TetR/AcrR family transcriptional regulator [Nocardioides pocheonensis]RNM11819.1 TetR/AcrR family transcriptional regulator [Nocardioides pocheonensis]